MLHIKSAAVVASQGWTLAQEYYLRRYELLVDWVVLAS